MHGMIEDLRLALRQLRRSPGFAATVILTLAIGIGATTAIFTLVYDVMLRPLPYPHAERIVTMEEQVAEFRDIYPSLPMNAHNFAMWQQNSRSFEAMALMRENSMPMGGSEHPLEVSVLSSTPDLFRVLGAQPMLGRAFLTAEAQPGHDHVAVLMHGTWRDQFHSDPSIVGQIITLNGFPFTVIGVMPESFHLPPVQAMAQLGAGSTRTTAAIVPRTLAKDELQQKVGDFNYVGLGLLREGVSVAQASDEINTLQRQITSTLVGEEKATLSGLLMPFQEKLIGTNRKPLLILLGAVAGLLLVGCVNITNLLLARATGRRQQLAVASALGARRGELMWLAMRETIVLAAFGCVLGILLADALIPLMQRYLPAALNFRGGLKLNWTGAVCTLTLSVLAALLAGIAPAVFAARTRPAEVLHSESRLASESRSSKRMRRILVAAEVAISVALVLLTGLMTVSLLRMMRVDRGFESAHTVTADIVLPRSTYNANGPRQKLYAQVLARLRQLPGVDHAGFVQVLPLAGDQWVDMIRVAGDGRPPMQLPTQHFRQISPDYLQAIHLPLVAGRQLTESDLDKRVALISELTAKTMWPERDPIGQTFTRGGVSGDVFTVIGVVRDARTISLAKPDPMVVYMPYWFRADNAGGLAVSTKQDPSQMADAMRKTIWSIDPAVAVPEVRSMGGLVEDSVANRRFEMDLLLLFAISALLLAGLGIYGVVTYSVVQREKEIGLRMALGARMSHVYRLVMREGLVPVFAGAAIGVLASLTLARLFRSMLFEVSPYNPGIIAIATGVLLLIGATACLLPARRAANVEPMEALRSE